MPSTPTNQKCRELGCRNNKTYRSAFCVEHGGQATEKHKANSKLYNSAYWKQKRTAQLSVNPLCASCLLDGRVVPAEHIDHVFPHRQDNNKFKSNLFQSLCAPCHSLKTQEENNGTYLYYSSNGIVKYTESDYVHAQTLDQTEFTQAL
jgi:5-methylcytosine-specific restriction endonuclease McrA